MLRNFSTEVRERFKYEDWNVEKSVLTENKESPECSIIRFYDNIRKLINLLNKMILILKMELHLKTFINLFKKFKETRLKFFHQ